LKQPAILDGFVMSKSPHLPLFVVAVLAFATVASTYLSAQQSPTQRVRGVVERVEGKQFVVASREGKVVPIQIGDKADVIGLEKIGLADVPSNAFVGVAATPLENGSLKAISIHVFPETSRGFNEGSRPYDVRPYSSMTNGALAERIKSVEGDVLTVKFKGGERQILVTPESSIVRFEPGNLVEIIPGAKVVATVTPRADGSTEAVRILVGRNGLTPAL
jgi:hypothetical protein